jgi:DNA replication protein DnaC
MIRGALIGSRFDHCTLENFQVTRFNAAAHEACQKVARRDVEGVFLLGPVGVGKTHLLIGLMKAFTARHTPESVEEELVEVPHLRELVERQTEDDMDTDPVGLDPSEQFREPEVEFWPMLDLVSELRAEIKIGELELSRRCRMCDLLVIDDLGAERATDFVREELDRIVDWRYRDRKPIAVATNLEDREIVEKYGWRAISRWTESCVRVRMEGPDYRTERR